jgi:hypothetical protein
MAEYPEVFRVTDYGGGASDSTAGGSGIEYYAVRGLGPNEFESTHALGLPRIGEFHPDERLNFMGTVQSVDRVAEMPPTLWIARVRYNVGGTFNFGTSLGSRLSSSYEMIRVPVLTFVSGTGGYVWATPGTFERRQRFTRIESTRSTISLSTFQKHVAANLGKAYDIDGEIYLFEGAGSARDVGGNVRIDTMFGVSGRIEPSPVGTYEMQSVGIPGLLPHQTWTANTETGVIRSVFPRVDYGEPLPWL